MEILIEGYSNPVPQKNIDIATGYQTEPSGPKRATICFGYVQPQNAMRYMVETDYIIWILRWRSIKTSSPAVV